ncbi:Os06g0146900 [Oryza sativa Japonica Group]|uniref:Os06g0146900 protein n=3 Tax=Oryza TaxID=4527 RepID=A0A0P0WSU6_ORYSJ|nr:hypothetical protein OsJ_14984 [Oryza sativa Japonica Group]KAB8101203.1 hypothetical protein EE612_031914 [Oryza sativa]KAF2925177.1 hypothetical protein DAI22_06g033300 [Oryza sativa Japonica Group]BAF18712.1 Os06g0146900 [Oryza sativa Japonica Group]BAS96147.1 Os06g0146900 [Oryza sativa Japonica Group]|eukprot:NP_001056798.1 Os06g0146900 [Oryza sativa Japonica Group]
MRRASCSLQPPLIPRSAPSILLRVARPVVGARCLLLVHAPGPKQPCGGAVLCREMPTGRRRPRDEQPRPSASLSNMEEEDEVPPCVGPSAD